jgi:O-phospho-L-seryl-tRNASec:L-selenocysteinyl-tRNA synthase
VATGMAMMLCLSAFRKKNPTATHVIWCRIDQKSCFKCILTAGLIPLIVEPVRDADSDALITNLKKIEELLVEYKEKVR